MPLVDIAIGTKIVKEDFNIYDYIFGMDQENIRDLKKKAPQNCKAEILLFGDFDPEGDRIIRDPYYFPLSEIEHKTFPIDHVIVHIDMKGAPPKLAYLKSLLPILKDHSVTGLLLEYEDMFPYGGQIRDIASKHCYNGTELGSFLKEASDMGFLLIPLIPTFGHMEMVLKLHKFKMLREDPNYPDSICPSNPESTELLYTMVKQVITLHERVAKVTHIHIGGDEVSHINKCERCSRSNLTTEEIYIKHIQKLSSSIRWYRKDIQVLVWDDMFTKKAVHKILRNTLKLHVVPVLWDYSPRIQKNYATLHFLLSSFGDAWVATAFKGADGENANIPDFAKRYSNHKSWFDFLVQYKLVQKKHSEKISGIILTGWSRYSHFSPLCEFLPVSIPGLLLNLMYVRSHFVINNKIGSYRKDVLAEFSQKYSCNTKLTYQNINYRINDCVFSLATSEYIDLFQMLNDFESDIKSFVKSHTVNQSDENIFYKRRHIKPDDMVLVKGRLSSLYVEFLIIYGKLKKIMRKYYDDYVIHEFLASKVQFWEGLTFGF